MTKCPNLRYTHKPVSPVEGVQRYHPQPPPWQLPTCKTQFIRVCTEQEMKRKSHLEFLECRCCCFFSPSNIWVVALCCYMCRVSEILKLSIVLSQVLSNRLVPDCVGSNLRGSKFKIFLGGACPQTPLVGTHTYACVSVLFRATIILLPPCFPTPPPPTQNPVWNSDVCTPAWGVWSSAYNHRSTFSSLSWPSHVFTLWMFTYDSQRSVVVSDQIWKFTTPQMCLCVLHSIPTDIHSCGVCVCSWDALCVCVRGHTWWEGTNHFMYWGQSKLVHSRYNIPPSLHPNVHKK